MGLLLIVLYTIGERALVAGSLLLVAVCSTWTLVDTGADFHTRHATLLAVWCAGVCIAVLLFIMVLAQRSEASPVLVASSIMLPVFAGVLSYGWLDVAAAEAGGMLQICAPVGLALGLVSLTFALRMLKRRASLRAQSNSELVQYLRARSELTKTEREGAVRLARGMNARQIADDLVVSPATVASHRKRIYTKLGIHSQQDICQVLFTK